MNKNALTEAVLWGLTKTMESGHRVCSPTAIQTTGGARPANTLIGNFLLVVSTAALIFLASGCATPTLQPADPQLLLRSDPLSFLKDGRTTREEAVLKLGIPSAQIEGEKILMYQLRADKDGKWHLIAPRWDAVSGLRTWSEATCSLVLVFGEDGVLREHSLVLAQ